MKTLILTSLLVVALTACGRQIPEATVANVSEDDCRIIDACTHPTDVDAYQCRVTKYTQENSKISQSEFEGKSCIVVSEDYHTVTNPDCSPTSYAEMCTTYGWGWSKTVPCCQTTVVQGPGAHVQLEKEAE
jgi:hypothetical protein